MTSVYESQLLAGHILDWRLIRSIARILGTELQQVVPLALENNRLHIGCFRQPDSAYRAQLSGRLKSDLRVSLLPETERNLWLQLCQENLDAQVLAATQLTVVTNGDQPDEQQISLKVQGLLMRALESRASDIHLEPMPEGLLVRYRVDGLLKEVELLPVEWQKLIVARVKVMADLDIANQRTPQDGRSTQTLGKTTLDLRVSTLPCLHGEKAVIRLLNKSNRFMSLEEIGLVEQTLEVYTKWLDRAQGLILITGPTGSGKTSTLYASLMRLLNPNKNIVTIEDPVEYQLSSVNQVQVNPKAGLTFAGGLRSILRQDPDIIMVGEIRDPETAQTVFQAAVTGHLVLATIHTDDAPSTVNRLIYLGVEPYLISAALLGVVAQRLVRRACPRCATYFSPTARDLTRLGLSDSLPQTDEVRWVKPTGCEACQGVGFRGREGIFEVMPVDNIIRQMIHGQSSVMDMKAHLRQLGLPTLGEAGLQKVMAGKTTIEEILRVVSL
ncbi:GspE/PulE family protein [Candidatus Cyanaurora vandensis]|uniref:GspE/PulE family protein n=1 Tax=Candidatus Cyanaurora vandensis TaxID=2714958 RepID=UPI00257B3E65|nr:GspE/PulE family protein [Candidatus Cyanaurora vandensis]